jgi:phospholipid/cholesterol/gamma-HCH transport system substrate-binding protein
MSVVRRRTTARLLRLAAVVAAGALALAGCQFRGLQSVHLPGGAAGSDSYKVNIEFSNVTDLVPQSSVRANDVVIGDVDKVSLHHFTAVVTVSIKNSVHFPANAVASLQQTSLLGEKYVAIGPPTTEPPQGRLEPGATIPLSRTQRTPEVEEVFGALAAVLNGGGVEQLQTIAVELSAALSGNEAQVRDLLGQLNTFVGSLDQNKQEIVRALDSLDHLTSTLAAQKQTIATALTQISPGLKVLADQQANLTAMLQSLSQLGAVGTKIINASKDNTVADLAALVPVLQRLAQAGTYLPHALELLLTYPFPKNVTDAIFGDYTGLYATLDVTNIVQNLSDVIQQMFGSGPPPVGGAPTPALTAPSGSSATTSPLAGLGNALGSGVGGLVSGSGSTGSGSTGSGGSSGGLLGLLSGGLR